MAENSLKGVAIRIAETQGVYPEIQVQVRIGGNRFFQEYKAAVSVAGNLF